MTSDAIDLAASRDRLNALREELQAALAAGGPGAETVALDQGRTGRLTRMDALAGQAMARAASGRRSLRLQAVQAALARLDTGDYGLCVDCAGAIAPARLRYDPAASLCIDCAGRREG